MSEDLGRGVGAVAGAALRGPSIKARLSRHVRQASGYLDEEEKLVAPVAQCTRGGRKPLFLGLSIVVLTVVVGIFIADRIGEPAGTIMMFGGMGAGLLVMCLALPVTHKHAVALTDRRLLVFRRSGVSGRHIMDVFLAVPRSDVSTSFKKWLGPQGWGVLSLKFAPSTGKAPIQLDFWSIDTPIAEAIHLALATPATSAPGSTKLPAGTR